MVEILTSSDMDNAMTGGVERVVFPANANILLNDGSFEDRKIKELEDIGQSFGRLVHLP